MPNMDEPKSGWNLPAGVFGDEPHFAAEDRVCGACRHCLEECCDYGACALRLPDDVPLDWAGALEAVGAARVDMQEDTCGRWAG